MLGDSLIVGHRLVITLNIAGDGILLAVTLGSVVVDVSEQFTCLKIYQLWYMFVHNQVIEGLGSLSASEHQDEEEKIGEDERNLCTNG